MEASTSQTIVMTYIVSIASNHNHEENFEKIKKLISSQLSASNINYAEIILTQPIGTGYPPVPYYNTAVRFSSPFPMIEINERLKDIELSCGRTPEMKEKKIVPIDLDIIVADGQIVHKDYSRFWFVKRLVDSLI